MNCRKSLAMVAGLTVLLVFALSGCSDDTSSGDGKNPDLSQDVSSDGSGSDVDAVADPDTVDDPDAVDNPDAVDDPDVHIAPGFQLSGQLVPTGGLALSNGFTLSGHLSPAMAEKTSSSASFSLKIKPINAQTAP